MSHKRSHIDIDPDYEDVTDHQVKRQRVLENDAKEATVRKIESIIRSQFEGEIRQKEAEINMVDQRLNQSRLLMDRLRACIVASQYSSTILGTRDRSQPPSIHPTVKKQLGKAPATVTSESSLDNTQSGDVKPPPLPIEKPNQESSLPKPQPIPASSILSPVKLADTRGGRFKTKHKIIVGNVSKFIPLDRREVNDQSTHKWMLYVRGPKDKPHINTFVKKVWFFLHPSYKPNDLVEIDNPPYHLTRRGWGEFPVRVQLHFRDQRNKRVDIIHNLKLDKTCTGLQTLGAETVIEVELERDNPRSESPSVMNEVDSKHGRHTTGNSGVETTTAENVDHVDENSDNNTVPKFMDTEVTINHDSPVNGKDPGCHGDKISNGIEIPKSNGDCDVKNIKDDSARVIHLKTKDEVRNELCKNSKTLNHSTSSESTNSKSDVMYMRCKDQQGNFMLLPYKINPDKTGTISGKNTLEKGKAVISQNKSVTQVNKPVTQIVTQANKTSAQSVTLGNKSAASTVTTSAASIPIPSTSTTAHQTASTSVTPPAAKPTTNLVLKVTPTGLKLVPADSETIPAPQPPPTNSLLHSSPVNRPKLKSLLTGGSASAFSSVKASSAQKSPISTSNLPSKQTVNSDESAKQTSNTQSLVLANIGDKHYLLKVVPQPDNQVLLVPNKQTSIPQALSTTPQAMSKSAQNVSTLVSRPVQQQRSLLSTNTTSVNQPQSEQKSLTLSFGLSPFSVQSSLTQKGLLSSTTSQKAVSNNAAANSERKIHVWKKKIKDMFEVREEVKPMMLSDYPDLLSVVRAAVRRHPVVKEVVDRSVHPYCARTTEEWLSWNVGKRRSSEWQRAASVRKFIESHVKESYYKGEQLWSTRKIMSWCRLHAFSPHHLESTVQSEGEPAVSGVSDKHTPAPPVRPLSSLTDHQTFQDRLDTLLTDLPVSDESEGELDIVSVDLPKVKLKAEPMESEVVSAECEILPPSKEAHYVQDVAQQIGIKFQPVQIEPEVMGSVGEDMIYKVMSRLAEDVLRESFSVTRQANTRSEQHELKAEHVFKALNNMAATDFLSNHHLGIHDDTSQPGVR